MHIDQRGLMRQLVLTILMAAQILPTHVADFLPPASALVTPENVCMAAIGFVLSIGAVLAVAVRCVCMCFRVR